MSNRHRLQCTNCQILNDIENPKPNCTQCDSILEYVILPNKYKTIQFSGPLTFWRYQQALPKVTKKVTLGEGGTPLQKAQRLAKNLNLNNLYLKNETQNPTNSFKDRSATLIISDAVSRGYDNIVCATNGNHGASISAYATNQNITCNLIIPKAIDIGKLAQMMMYDAKIEEAGENIEEAINRARKLGDEMGWYQATTELNPLSVEGLKTISYEIVEQHGVPNWIILAMGSGATLYAIWKGFKELENMEKISKKPRIIGVQAKGFAPIVGKYSGEGPITEGHTEATAIRVANPIYGDLALKALHESNGVAITVSDDEMFSAGQTLAKLEGIFAEPASAASIACLTQSRINELISPEDNVVCLITSSGLKTDDILKGASKYRRSPRLGSRFSTKERILKIIHESSTYGYEIWKNLRNEMTLGAVYQHLSDLEERGLISSRLEGKRKMLDITERGIRVINALEELQVLL